MVRRQEDKKLAAELELLLAARFEGMRVDVAHSDRWDRMCVTFRWSGFEGLLPEERFHRLAGVIPEGLRESRLKGFVWLELAPNESIESYLKLPRSEDIAEREAAVHKKLLEAAFYRALVASLGPRADTCCKGDFSGVEAVLSAKRWSRADVRDAKLVFIRHGAYCDCQVLQTVQPQLAEAYADAG